MAHCVSAAPFAACYETVGSERKTPDRARIVANPTGWTFTGGLVVTHNNAFGGNEFFRINTGGFNGNTLVEIEWDYFPATPTVTHVAVSHGGGNDLTDADGMDAADATLFDVNGNVLAGPFPLNLANNGGDQQTPIVGGPVSGVHRLRLSNLSPADGAATNLHIREVGLFGPPLLPAALIHDCDGVMQWIDAATGLPLAEGTVVRSCDE